MHKDIRAYNNALSPASKAIARLLAEEIDRGLPDAESKIWHRHPVWFLDGNPIVGYSQLKGCVRLLFWSGQSFDEPGLAPEGSFKAAEARYTSVDEVRTGALKRWLRKAKTIQWDYKNIVKRRGVLVKLAAFGLAFVLTACAARMPAASAAPPASTAAAITFNTWAERSAEYPGLVLQVYRQATTAIEAAAAGKPRGSWAVILDADETVISNIAFQIELERAGQTYTSALWNGWTKRREAVPMPGAKAYLDRVRALGGRIAIVTNRLESECADSRAVFDAHALAYDVMLCKPDGGPSEKNSRFAAVAEGRWPGATGPVEVLAWIGDNIQDFPSLTQAVRQQGEQGYAAFGSRFFLLPNPMYGSWQ